MLPTAEPKNANESIFVDPDGKAFSDYTSTHSCICLSQVVYLNHIITSILSPSSLKPAKMSHSPLQNY